MLGAAMTSTLGLVAMFLVIAAALVLIRLHTLPTGLDPRRDAISDYGTTPFHLYYRVMVAAAIAALASRAVRQLRRFFGLVERILYAAFVAWLIVVASSLAS